MNNSNKECLCDATFKCSVCQDSAPKHTPGPWSVRNDSDKAPNTYRVRADLSHRKHEATEESVCITGTEANARLIAAAPELLEALESIAKNACCDRCQEAALVAKAALAKVL